MKLTIYFVDNTYTVVDYGLCCQFSKEIRRRAALKPGSNDEMEIRLNQASKNFPAVYQWMYNHRNDGQGVPPNEPPNENDEENKKRKYKSVVTDQDRELLLGYTASNMDDLENISVWSQLLQIPQLREIVSIVISDETKAKRAREGPSVSSSSQSSSSSQWSAPPACNSREFVSVRELVPPGVKIYQLQMRDPAVVAAEAEREEIRKAVVQHFIEDSHSTSSETEKSSMETDGSPESGDVFERGEAEGVRIPDPAPQAAGRERSESMVIERSDDSDLASIQENEESTAVRVITTEGFYTVINLTVFNLFTRLINDNYHMDQGRRTITLHYVRKEIFEAICRWILSNLNKKEYHHANYPRKSMNDAPNTDLTMTEMDEVFFLEYYNNNLLQPLIEAAQMTEVFALADLAIKYELNKGFGRETRYKERKCTSIREVKKLQNEEIELKAQRTPSVSEQRRHEITGDQLSAAIASIKPYSQTPSTSSQVSAGPSEVTSSSSVSSSQIPTTHAARSRPASSEEQPTQSTQAVDYRVARVSPLSSSSDENAPNNPGGVIRGRPAPNPQSSPEDDNERINPQLPELRREDEHTTSAESSGSSPANPPATSSSGSSSNRTPPGDPNGDGTSGSEGTDPNPEDDSGLDSTDGENGDDRRNRGNNVQGGGNEEKDVAATTSREEGAPCDAESNSSSSSEKKTESQSSAESKSESESEVLGINEDTRSSVGDARQEENLENPPREQKYAPVPPNTPRKTVRKRSEQ